MKNKLEALLLAHDNFIVEGRLNKNKLMELANNYDKELLQTLMEETEVKNHFFSKVTRDILVFKREVFLQFINNKEFLPDSFTIYKSRIGLATKDNKYLSENNDIILNFPYKDCVLEGGQDKEDAKREEKFFNKILAPNEINRLLDKKVLHKFKRYDIDGVHIPKHIEENDNLIIKGNNLVVLHSLQHRYAGKIKLIYIDPPYNTENDSFGYNDTFKHSTWLTFMKNRLEIAYKLLRDDGVIFVHCDYHEDAYLRVLMDGIFGNDNYVSTIAVKSNSISGNKTQHKEKTILKNKDSIHVYKKKNILFNPQYIAKTEWDTHYNGFLELKDNKYIDRKLKDVLVEQSIVSEDYRLDEDSIKNKEFFSFVKKYQSSIFRSVNSIPKDLKELSLKKPDEIVFLESDAGDMRFAKGGKRLSLLSSVFKNIDGEMKLAQLLGDLWTDIDFQNTQNQGGVSFTNAKKPEQLLKRIIELTTNSDDIVLDFFAGSGTTGAVAHKLGRQYICIEQMDYVEDITIKRLQNVINGDPSGISSSVDWQSGGSFIYCELKNDAQNIVQKIQASVSPDELRLLFNDMKQSSFLSYRIDPKKMIEEDFIQFSLSEQKQLLLELVDNNNLYVNYSDIDDTQYGISDEEKYLNKQFYGEE